MDFSKRLESFLKRYELSASTLADQIDINRSTISHLLSGRNKPSLDLIMKLHEHFPHIDLEWWIYGEGNLKSQKEEIEQKPKRINKIESETFDDPNTESFQKLIPPSPTKNENSKKIQRVLILYEDGSFDDYRN